MQEYKTYGALYEGKNENVYDKMTGADEDYGLAIKNVEYINNKLGDLCIKREFAELVDNKEINEWLLIERAYIFQQLWI